MCCSLIASHSVSIKRYLKTNIEAITNATDYLEIAYYADMGL